MRARAGPFGAILALFFHICKVFVDNRGIDTVKYKSCRRMRRGNLLLLQANGLMSSIDSNFLMEV